MSKIKLSAFRWVPPAAQGLVRDLRVRWALEEAGMPYEEQLVALGDEQKSVEYRKLQPFGQVPALDLEGLRLFESGAIVLHIAERSSSLMPEGESARARVRTWMFAALNSVEPPISMYNFIALQPGAPKEGVRELQATIGKWIGQRLDELATFLGERDYLLEDRFTAADLLMVCVLRILRDTDFVSSRPTLQAYRDRGEARPAFQRALAAQLAPFEKYAKRADAPA